jgi:menaquinone-dependent protoporphyrinogen oxidase
MPKALLVYHGIYGHTRKICEALQAELATLGHNAEIVSLAECEDARLDASEAIVIGAAIRNGKHNSAVLEFIRVRKDLLEAKPSGFFSVNLVARKPEKDAPETWIIGVTDSSIVISSGSS